MDAGAGFTKLSANVHDQFEIELPTEADRRRHLGCMGKLREYGRLRALQVAVISVVLAIVVIFVVAAAYSSRSHGTAPEPDTRQTFSAIVVGDWGRHGTTNQMQVANMMARVAQNTTVDVIISVGDNFYTWGVHNLSDPQFNSTWRDVYTQPALAEIPWAVALGNHDWRGSVSAQVNYTRVAKRWHMPARYFSFQSAFADTCIGFAVTDTSPYSYNISDPHVLQKMPTLPSATGAEQMDWLDGALSSLSSSCRWVVAIGHHPFYSAGEHGNHPDLRDRFLPLLKQYKVATYIAGHDHDQQHIVRDDYNLFVSGAGSDTREELSWGMDGLQWASVDPGFMMMNVNTTHASYLMYNADGSLMYTFVQPALK